MKTLTIQLPDKLYNVLESYSRTKGKEVSEIVKEWTKLMVWEHKKKEALSAYKEERLTVRDLAELLGLSYWEVDELLEREGIAIIR